MGKCHAKKGIISEQKILRISDFLMRVSTLLLPAYNTVNLRGNLVRHYLFISSHERKPHEKFLLSWKIVNSPK